MRTDEDQCEHVLRTDEDDMDRESMPDNIQESSEIERV
jgi:hypothetical protein